MRERRCFVQFIHPGGEHEPDEGDLKRWNRSAHRRKFLKDRGRCLCSGELRESDLVFWGEWEPESRVLRRYANSAPDQPHFLYEPYYVDHGDSIWRQNTDPFIFGDALQYTGCMQHTQLGPTQLRFLAPGSLVLFGSCRAKARFVVDTVFVVSDFVDHCAADWSTELAGRISKTYRAVTIEPWYRAALPADRSHRLYFGATLERRIGGMFSFFPCQQHIEDGPGFARPQVELPGLVTSHLTQGKKLSRDLSLVELGQIWQQVVKQVEEQGCSLGVHAELPRMLPDKRAHVDEPNLVGRC